MTTEVSQAWILHKRLSGDSSAWLTFFTYDLGVISVFFKGARKAKNVSLLQTFTPLYLCCEMKRDWRYVRQLELSAMPCELKGEALFAGLYVNELVYYLLTENEPAPLLFTSYSKVLAYLSQTPTRFEIAVILREFEFEILHHAGYELLLTHDVHGHQIKTHSYYRYLPGQGFYPDSQGFSGETLFAILNANWQEPLALKAAKHLFQQALHHALAGREMRARALYYAYLQEQGSRS